MPGGALERKRSGTDPGPNRVRWKEVRLDRTFFCSLAKLE